MNEKESYKKDIDRLLFREKRYRDPSFSATRLAEMLGISVYKLSRVLRREYDATYPELVHAPRIQDAMRHLKDSRFAPCSVEDIGQMVGFRNAQSFYAAFRKATGMTPNRFRLL